MLGFRKKEVSEDNWSWKQGHGEDRPTQDVIVLFSDNGTAEIAPIAEINEDRILAYGEVEHSVPLEDTKVFIGRYGRIFTYRASEDNITDTKRIAALERSTVLRQITLFEKERVPEAAKMSMGKILLIGAAVLIVIFLLFKK
jgi:hypothetical protein